jgi:hypothetical protein
VKFSFNAVHNSAVLRLGFPYFLGLSGLRLVIRELGNSLKKRSDEFGLIPLYFIKCYQNGSCLTTDYTLAKSGLLLSHSVRLCSAPAPTRRTYPSGLRLLGESSASPSPENHAGKGGITGNYPEMDVCRIDLPTGCHL